MLQKQFFSFLPFIFPFFTRISGRHLQIIKVRLQSNNKSPISFYSVATIVQQSVNMAPLVTMVTVVEHFRRACVKWSAHFWRPSCLRGDWLSTSIEALLCARECCTVWLPIDLALMSHLSTSTSGTSGCAR